MEQLSVEQIDDWLAYKILVNAGDGPIDWKDRRIREQEKHLKSRLAEIPDQEERRALMKEHREWVAAVEAYEGEPW